MRLSRLSNRQLLRLLKNGEVRFAFFKPEYIDRIEKLIKTIVPEILSIKSSAELQEWTRWAKDTKLSDREYAEKVEKPFYKLEKKIYDVIHSPKFKELETLIKRVDNPRTNEQFKAIMAMLLKLKAHFARVKKDIAKMKNS